MVNGFEQRDGREFQATAVEFRDQTASQSLIMNLEKAYPAEAGIESLRRELRFIRVPAAQVYIRDSWTLSRGPSNMRYFFYAAARVEQLQPGRLAVLVGQRRLLFEYDPPGMTVRCEPVTVADETLRGNWGDRLDRIVFEYQESRASGAVQFRFRGE